MSSTAGYRAVFYEGWSGLSTKLLVAIFFCGIFEGAARKWVLPTSIPELSYLAYLSKFLVFFLIGIASAVSIAPSRTLFEFRGYLHLGLFMIFCGALLSAFSGFSIAGGILTLVMVVVGPVLAYVSGSKVQLANTTQVLRWIAILSIFPAVLGVIQFGLPATHVLNKYVGNSSWTDVVTDLGRVRATGTFSFISGMSAMAVVCVWTGLCLRTLSAKNSDRLLGLATVVAGFVCGFSALSRSALFMGLALIGARLLLINRDRQIFVLMLIGAIGYGFLSFDPPKSRDGLDVTLTNGVLVRHSLSDSGLSRIESWMSQFSAASSDVPLGAGFGLSQVGGRAVDSGRRALVSYEAELARLVAEVGVLGVLGVLTIRIGLLLALFHAWRRMLPSPTRDALLLSMMTVFLFFVSNTAFNHVAAGFVWPIAAIGLAWGAIGERTGERTGVRS